MQSEELNQYSQYQLYIRVLQDQLRAAQQQEEKQAIPEEDTSYNEYYYQRQTENDLMLSNVAMSPENTSWTVYALDSNNSMHGADNANKSVSSVKTNSTINNFKSLDTYNDQQQNNYNKLAHSTQQIGHSATFTDNNLIKTTNGVHNVITVPVQQPKHRHKKAYKVPTKDVYVQTKERRKDRVYLYLSKQYSKLKNKLVL